GSWTSIQFFQEAVIAILALQSRHTAVRIIQVSEYNRFRGTSLLAGCHNLAVLNRSVFLLGIDLDAINSLYTVTAFLHHAPAAYADVGIADTVQALRIPIGIQEEIE